MLFEDVWGRWLRIWGLKSRPVHLGNGEAFLQEQPLSQDQNAYKNVIWGFWGADYDDDN